MIQALRLFGSQNFQRLGPQPREVPFLTIAEGGDDKTKSKLHEDIFMINEADTWLKLRGNDIVVNRGDANNSQLPNDIEAETYIFKTQRLDAYL